MGLGIPIHGESSLRCVRTTRGAVAGNWVCHSSGCTNPFAAPCAASTRVNPNVAVLSPSTRRPPVGAILAGMVRANRRRGREPWRRMIQPGVVGTLGVPADAINRLSFRVSTTIVHTRSRTCAWTAAASAPSSATRWCVSCGRGTLMPGGGVSSGCTEPQRVLLRARTRRFRLTSGLRSSNSASVSDLTCAASDRHDSEQKASRVPSRLAVGSGARLGLTLVLTVV